MQSSQWGMPQHNNCYEVNNCIFFLTTYKSTVLQRYMNELLSANHIGDFKESQKISNENLKERLLYTFIMKCIQYSGRLTIVRAGYVPCNDDDAHHSCCSVKVISASSLLLY